MKPSRSFDETYGKRIIGIDEVGLGSYVGPVVAAAVFMDFDPRIDGINDSKKLSEKKRESIFELLISKVKYCIGICDVEEINQTDILKATRIAMLRAYEGLEMHADRVLIDGRQPPFLPCAVEAITKGDNHSLAIASASIIAKVTRDRMLGLLAKEHPEYGWDRNKGYGTAQHQEALEKYGVTKYHRLGYEPVRRIYAKENI